MDWSLLIGLMSAILGGGALFKLIEFLIQRKDNNLENRIIVKLDGLDVKIDKIDRKVDDSAAKQARARILRFSDELQTGRKFSKDSFNQTFSDISDYEAHCKKYKDFKNSQAEQAIKNVKIIHAELLEQERNGQQDAFL